MTDLAQWQVVLTLLETVTPTLIVVNLAMPKMDGQVDGGGELATFLLCGSR